MDEARRKYMPATVSRGLLVMELAAKEAGRRKHQNWRRVSAADLLVVLDELGFKITVWPSDAR